MTAWLEFNVSGTPVPQGSKRIGRHGARPVILDDNDDVLRPWRQRIVDAYDAHCAQQDKWLRRLVDGAWPGGEVRRIGGPVVVRLRFYLPRPAGHFGTGRNAGQLKPSAPFYPAVRPDLDKYVRAVLDALTTCGAYEDDSRVVDIDAVKRYPYERPEGLCVRLEALP